MQIEKEHRPKITPPSEEAILRYFEYILNNGIAERILAKEKAIQMKQWLRD
jgi:hypothetical protein